MGPRRGLLRRRDGGSRILDAELIQIGLIFLGVIVVRLQLRPHLIHDFGVEVDRRHVSRRQDRIILLIQMEEWLCLMRKLT